GFLGEVEYLSKQYPEAIEHYRESVRLAPPGVDGHFYSTDYAGWRARYLLSQLLIREIVSSRNAPVEQKRRLFREAQELYHDAERSDTVPESQKPQFQDLAKLFARLQAQLAPSTP